MITDVQILTLAMAVVIPLSLLIYSNSRITDAKETLRAEIGESKQVLRTEMTELRSEMKMGFERLSNKIDHIAEEVATLKELNR